ncbi:SDR family NAD(P)-dependent oxidoreductase [Paenibacillus nasutitermitis]|uniref:Beta-ketoacyl-ACP reductase n=1 Tax=Paenibacillus nasutitermitis TaxID=1652958 RepID=A0A917DKF8_9BACL|nr:3-oxoacyl-ACP reductase family protein [Paenibacillus nasutitermitis]GGD47498.1 beta-ketoacyl-ACP reductase [Paenibacillus nasutitermitis]
MRLKDKVAIVTGSSRSIGAQIAKRFAREGAKVVVNYPTEPELAEEVVRQIQSEGGEAFAFRADVTKEAEVQAMVAETVARFGTVHILVNNAGIDPRQAWYEITDADWDLVMDTNVRSQLYTAKAVYPYMQKQQYGKIINVSSVTQFTGQKNFLHYVTSKGAIIGFTRALAREVGNDGITVNCITPGAVLTESEGEDELNYDPAETARRMATLQSIPRRETAEDLEGAFVFFAAPDSDFITGQTLNVDGGWVMH